jgi:predicted transposase YbfD/YdcC
MPDAPAHDTASTSDSLDLLAHFDDVRDPRLDRRKKHPLLDIIGLTICAVIAGADTFVGIERFGHARHDWLAQFLDLPNGIPSHDTIGAVWSRIDPAEFESGFRQWIACLADSIEGIVAIDGKEARRSHDRAAGKPALRLVSAWACEQEVVMGQQAVPDHTNETKTLPPLLQMLELEGAIVTLDAAGCYPPVAEAIQKAGADYVITLKGNQGTLRREAEALLARYEAAGVLPEPHTTTSGGHGRVEVRRGWAVSLEGEGATLPTEEDGTPRWPGLRTLGRVVRERHLADGGVEVEERLFISSLPADAERLMRAVRQHWHVENKLHWTLDVAFDEDGSRVRSGHAAENLAMVRRLAVNLLKQETSRSVGIKVKRMEAAWNPDYLLKVLTGSD